MPELYFFSKVCFEIKKEHTIVQSFKWIGKDCRSNARIITTSPACFNWSHWICNSLYDYRCNHLSFKLKKSCCSRTKNKH